MATWRYEISFLALKNKKYSKRNFVSPRGYVVSFLSVRDIRKALLNHYKMTILSTLSSTYT